MLIQKHPTLPTTTNKLRDDLRMEWEQKTGQKWPLYEKIVIKGGKELIEDSNYHAHHIIPVSHGGHMNGGTYILLK